MSIRMLSNRRVQRRLFPAVSADLSGLLGVAVNRSVNQPRPQPDHSLVINQYPIATRIPDAFVYAGECAEDNARLIFGPETVTPTPVLLTQHVSQMAINFAEDPYFQARANNYFDASGMRFLDEQLIESEGSLQARLDAALRRIASLETMLESFTGTVATPVEGIPHSTGVGDDSLGQWRPRVTKVAIAGGLLLLAYGIMRFSAPRIMLTVASLFSKTWTSLICRFGFTSLSVAALTTSAIVSSAADSEEEFD